MSCLYGSISPVISSFFHAMCAMLRLVLLSTDFWTFLHNNTHTVHVYFISYTLKRKYSPQIQETCISNGVDVFLSFPLLSMAVHLWFLGTNNFAMLIYNPTFCRVNLGVICQYICNSYILARYWVIAYVTLPLIPTKCFNDYKPCQRSLFLYIKTL